MDPDYYSVLGIEPTADFVAIEKAYRRKAMECHPDRGGSHADMLRINEAWEILSNPELRARYEKARQNASDATAQNAAAADSRRAHERAQYYPREWAKFEQWLDTLASDVTKARYGSYEFGYGDILWPTAGKSITGWLFIAAGAIFGALPLFLLLFDVNRPTAMIPVGSVMLVLAALGALVGAQLHRWIRSKTYHQKADLSKTLVVCENCGKKLRLPAIHAEILVTCSACGHKFSFKRDDNPLKFPTRTVLILLGSVGLGIAFSLILPTLLLFLTPKAHVNYVVSVARIMPTFHRGEYTAPPTAMTAEEYHNQLWADRDAAISLKFLPTDGVSEHLVRAGRALGDAQFELFKARVWYDGNPTPVAKEAVMSAAQAANKLEREFVENMPLALKKVYYEEFERDRLSHSESP